MYPFTHLVSVNTQKKTLLPVRILGIFFDKIENPEKSVNKVNLTSLRSQLHTLDQLPICFLYLDESGNPGYLSQGAAEVLIIKDRQNIESHLPLLAPLLEYSKNSRQSFKEIELKNSEGLVFTALISIHKLQFPGVSIPGVGVSGVGESETGSLIIFQNLSLLTPFFSSFEHYRNFRSLVVLISACLGSAIDPVKSEKLRTELSKTSSSEKEASPLGRLFSPETATDLSTATALAVDIADSILVPTFKVSVDIQSSVLLALARSSYLQLLGLLLLEAADFSGPYGKAKIRAVFKKSNEPAVQLLILCERGPLQTNNLSALERYLSKRYQPSSYRVANAEDNKTSLLSADPVLVRELGGNISSELEVPQETRTDTVRLAEKIATENKVDFQMKLLNKNLLAFSLNLPTVTKN